MTNHWIDIKNADVVLIIGSNAAEHHPVSFKWIMRAKDNGAALIHVDPKFSRTSARCDYHVPLRSGTDIAFLGGMVNYILESNSYFHDYVVNYTNASFIVGKGYDFKDGLFSGYDAKARKYDQSKWGFEKGPDGAPLRDATLKHERCVFNLMKKHYSRYTLKNVSDITGVSEENLLKVYKQFCATGKPDKAGTILYALGWTQHTVGVQNIRCSTLVQLLLGNIGVAGGGINALRGEPNVQGSTDHALLYHVLPGYIGLPLAPWQTLAQFNKAFCYGLLPKGEPGADYSYMYVMDKMYQGKIKGGFVFGVNPMNSFPNTNKMRKALDNLDWMVCAELHNSETTDNWHRPGVDPKKMKTEVFLLPSAHRVEKAGTISNSGRWLLWFDKAVEPAGEARNFADMFVPLINKLRELYKAEGGKLPEALLKMNWPEKYDPEEWTRRINGFFWADTKIGNRLYKKGDLVPAFGNLQADGSTSSLNWLYTGSYTEDEGNKSKRRDPTQTPMQAAIGLYPNWSWCWPVNRRILYNRASVDLNGKPYNPKKAVIEWDGKKWVGDVPDGPWAPQADTKNGKLAYIMTTDGYAQLYGPGRLDGPFPEHYEPAETPVARK